MCDFSNSGLDFAADANRDADKGIFTRFFTVAADELC